ncbi:hypothetical protein K504DRAFT_448129 [Pleomassaria siparia CBS 279.74]|uniref:Uncharacterized protein n=1 Tax=Pleomassaria siparia CBS 279.74 TaxID=1314801 RepID=A0A6G1K1P2_9PLEO|nr:hypothetical protein K504DRAFT_448129 [Pleomassaria siparia CBS 279.74]
MGVSHDHVRILFTAVNCLFPTIHIQLVLQARWKLKTTTSIKTKEQNRLTQYQEGKPKAIRPLNGSIPGLPFLVTRTRLRRHNPLGKSFISAALDNAIISFVRGTYSYRNQGSRGKINVLRKCCPAFDNHLALQMISSAASTTDYSSASRPTFRRILDGQAQESRQRQSAGIVLTAQSTSVLFINGWPFCVVHACIM